jgi:LPS-assembly lipoprotein
MWSRKHMSFPRSLPRQNWRGLVRIVVVLAVAGLTAGCFEPLYGRDNAPPGADSVRDKLAEVEIPIIPTHQGTPAARIAVSMRNALQYDFNGGAGPNAPTHRLTMTVVPTSISVIIDVASGRPTAEVDGVSANYQLVEIATGKTVLKDTAYAHVDVDSSGSQQRFAQQRAKRDAEDRAVEAVAETIRNRLASYFVAGT